MPSRPDRSAHAVRTGPAGILALEFLGEKLRGLVGRASFHPQRANASLQRVQHAALLPDQGAVSDGPMARHDRGGMKGVQLFEHG